MKKYVAYFRVSTDRQGQRGLGLDAQRDAVERFVNANGTLVGEFREVESGKRHKNRPQLLAALEQCKKVRATLVIAKLDRLGRNVAFISALMESDVEFVCCDNPHATRLMLHMVAAFAEHEREMISQRTKAALARVRAELRERGFRKSLSGRVFTKLGGPDPMRSLALANIARNLQPPPGHVLNFMLDMRDAGLSYRQIAVALNERGWRTPQGNRWHSSTARTVFLRLLPEPADPYAAMAGAVYEDLNELAATAIPSETSPMPWRDAISEGNRPMQDMNQALRMLDTFASVGARRFDITFLNIKGEKRGFRREQSLMQVRNSLPLLFPGLTERQNSLVVRPSGDNVQFIQLDDLDEAALLKLCTIAHLNLCTSAGNHQAWVAVSGHRAQEDQKELARRLRKGVAADIAASGATRLAGTVNYKQKYAPNFPTVTILSAVPGRMATPDQLEQLGLLAASEPLPKLPPLRVSSISGPRTWPDYARCVQGAPPNKDGSGPDRSMADWCYCLFAARRGFGAEDIEQRLLEVSERAEERVRLRDPGYARITAQKAVAAVERERVRSRA